jgi:hypothetical protein
MKKCPSCSRSYADDSLSFCLDDGSPLLSVGAGAGGSAAGQSPSYDPQATLQYNQARETNPPPPQGYGTGQPYTPVQTPSWSPTPPAGAIPARPKKSKAPYWILGSIVALALIVVAGAVLVIVLASFGETNTNNSNNSNLSNNRNSANANNSNQQAANKNSGSASGKDYQLRDDFSAKKWWVGANAFGQAEYVNDEYRLAATVFEGYVVVYGPKRDEYLTEYVTARVTARSVSGVSPSLGYGLAVYGKMESGNLGDYAFLIRTDESPAFRVALHQGGKETTLVTWTRSSLIRTGSTPNQLEVRVNDDQLSFYINGQYATSVSDSAEYKHGYVGFYTSDTTPVAFDDLEIYKEILSKELPSSPVEIPR